MKAAGITLITILYVVAGLFAAAVFTIPANPSLLPLTMLAGALALATAYGATVLLRSLLAVIREDRRKAVECSECNGSGYSGDSAVPNGACWDCQGTGLYNGGEL